MGLRRFVAKALDGVGRACRRVRINLLRQSQRSQIDRPNNPEEWSAIYTNNAVVVKTLQSPVAKAIADLTQPGDVLLEAGCGSAELSAELATAGRVIELCDFSQRILDQAVALFDRSGLPRPKVKLADLTQPLPWPDSAVDAVWSSGVLEHWTDEELRPIVREMARVSRRAVIALVPNARSVLYRMGKYMMEQEGLWPYGRELPRASLVPTFESAGLERIREFTVMAGHSPVFLRWTDPGVSAVALKWWSQLPADDPMMADQGYLLVTVGYKPGMK